MKEEQLIFLISQPRSGSTLTQKILGSHDSIYTRSEPWLMLHPMYSLKDSGIYTEYNFYTERIAFKSFIEDLPNKRQTYVNELKNMYLNLYGNFLTDENKYFLDKTPRYYLIVNELLEVFPNAKYLLLIRHPLAVLGSIIDTWTKENWYLLSEYKYDLIEAIDCYIDIIENKHDKVNIIYYEDVIKKNNENTLKDIFKFLELDSININFNTFKDTKWVYGDQNIYSTDSINSQNDIKWQNKLNNPQYWRIMYDYLNYIGQERFDKLGYSFNNTKQVLLDKKPLDIDEIIHKTFSFFSFLNTTKDCLILNNEQKKIIQQKDKELQQKDKELQQKDKELQEKNRIKKEIEYLLFSINKICQVSIIKNPIKKFIAYKDMLKAYHKIQENEK